MAIAPSPWLQLYFSQLPNPLCTGYCLPGPFTQDSLKALRGTQTLLLLVPAKSCLYSLAYPLCPISLGKPFLLVQETRPHLCLLWSPPVHWECIWAPNRLLLGALSIHVRLPRTPKIELSWWQDLGILFSFLGSQLKVLLISLYGITTLGHMRCAGLWPQGLSFSL